jgi:hypothetical protein
MLERNPDIFNRFLQLFSWCFVCWINCSSFANYNICKRENGCNLFGKQVVLLGHHLKCDI